LLKSQEKEDVKPFPSTRIPAGPQVVQQIEAINQKFDEAFNKAPQSPEALLKVEILKATDPAPLPVVEA